MKFKFILLFTLLSLLFKIDVEASTNTFRVLNQQEDFSITTSKLEELDLDFAKIKSVEGATAERLRVAFDLLGKTNTVHFISWINGVLIHRRRYVNLLVCLNIQIQT